MVDSVKKKKFKLIGVPREKKTFFCRITHSLIFLKEKKFGFLYFYIKVNKYVMVAEVYTSHISFKNIVA